MPRPKGLWGTTSDYDHTYYTHYIDRFRSITVVDRRDGGETYMYTVDKREKPPWWMFWETEVRHIVYRGSEDGLDRNSILELVSE